MPACASQPCLRRAVKVSRIQEPEARSQKIYTADVILPITSPPIKDGAVFVKDGRIIAIGNRDNLIAANPDEDVLEFRDALLMPGLVNLHGHLECSSFDFLAKPAPFPKWITKMIKASSKMQRSDWLAASRLGVKRYFEAGITCTADITRTGLGVQAVAEAGMPGIVYLEAVAIDNNNLADAVVDILERIKSAESVMHFGYFKLGLSPHSAYTLSESALKVCAQISKEYGLPLSIHLAETRAELELIRDGSGPLASTIGRRLELEAIKSKGSSKTPTEFLDGLALINKSLVAAHGVWLSEGDIKLLKKKNASVALCPTSNELLGSGEAPVNQFIKHGLRFGFGTDSIASNPDFDLFIEARKARMLLAKQTGVKKNQIPLSPEELIKTITIKAAEVLGLSSELGSIEPGKRADFAVIDYDNRQPIDPYNHLIEKVSKSSVSNTILAGEVVYKRS